MENEPNSGKRAPQGPRCITIGAGFRPAGEAPSVVFTGRSIARLPGDRAALYPRSPQAPSVHRGHQLHREEFPLLRHRRCPYVMRS